MLLSMATVAFADGINGPMQPVKIKVGINAQFPPFEYYNENGELYGFDIDLMNYIGERIGFGIEYVNMSFDKLIPAVMSARLLVLYQQSLLLKRERMLLIIPFHI